MSKLDMTNVLILAAGRVQSDSNADTYPACLVELGGVSVLEKIIANLKDISNANFTFALHSQDISGFHLDNIANLLVPGARIAVVPENTMGSACTALMAACELDLDQPLLIVSANEFVDQRFEMILNEFTTRNLDAGTFVFRSIHPRYSYVRLNESGLVTEAAQQNPISQIATAGVFWFKKTGDFIEAAKSAIRKNASTNNRFYLAPVFNELILMHKRIGVHEIDKANYIPLKTGLQIQQYEQGKS